MSRKVLIIEGEELGAEIATAYLQCAGFDVQVARDGERGVNHILWSPPDAVLCNIWLPRLRGTN